MERVWVVTGMAGQYSDSYWWIDSVHATKEGADERVAAMTLAGSEVEAELGAEFEYADSCADEDYATFERRRKEWHEKAQAIVDRHAPGARVPYERSHYSAHPDGHEVQP